MSIKHLQGKHDQKTHGNKRVGRRTYQNTYRESRAGGASVTEARGKAKEAAATAIAKRDERYKRMKKAQDERKKKQDTEPDKPKTVPIHQRLKDELGVDVSTFAHQPSERAMTAYYNLVNVQDNPKVKQLQDDIESLQRQIADGNNKLKPLYNNMAYASDADFSKASAIYKKALRESGLQEAQSRLLELQGQLVDAGGTPSRASEMRAIRENQRQVEQIMDGMKKDIQRYEKAKKAYEARPTPETKRAYEQERDRIQDGHIATFRSLKKVYIGDVSVDRARQIIGVDAPPVVNRDASGRSNDTITQVSTLTELRPRRGEVKIEDVKKGRESAEPWDSVLRIRSTSTDATIAHEYAHLLENGDVRKATNDFLEKRTQGDQVMRLNRIQPNSGYADNETTKPDKFLDPYIGRQYGKGLPTEVLSMGVQMMVVNPVEFALRDPDHFMLTVDILQGRYTND